MINLIEVFLGLENDTERWILLRKNQETYDIKLCLEHGETFISVDGEIAKFSEGIGWCGGIPYLLNAFGVEGELEMKFRTGFVSNSSSSSFVIGKNFMTKKQIDKFQDFVFDIGKDGYSETYISEGKYYFMGSIEQSDYKKLDDIIEELKLTEYIEYED